MNRIPHSLDRDDGDVLRLLPTVPSPVTMQKHKKKHKKHPGDEAIYFTVTGTGHRYGQDFFEPSMTVFLVKEPDNKYDTEAIKVELPGLGTVGYVANSAHTVLGESHSAGRLYDKMGHTATGTVLYVLPRGILCTLNPQKRGK